MRTKVATEQDISRQILSNTEDRTPKKESVMRSIGKTRGTEGTTIRVFLQSYEGGTINLLSKGF
jgi:hypothetical protein